MLKKFKKASSPHSPANDDQFECEPIRIGLSLGGGAVLGAFEAGVLEAIAEDLEKIGVITDVGGTSAGGGNAVAFGSGLNASGAAEGIRRLRTQWNIIKGNGNAFGRSMRAISDAFRPKNEQWPNMPSLRFNPMEIFKEFMPSYVAQFVSAMARNIVGDWESEVQNGRVRIHVNTVLEKRDAPGTFEHVVLSGKDLTPDGVGASANLRQLGVHYIQDTTNPVHMRRRAYDGAEAENGPLGPHIENKVTDCIMIILYDRRHNQLDKKGELKHAEIHSNALDFAASDFHSPMRLHAIEIETIGGEIGGLAHMNDSSKMNVDREFVDLLHAAGMKAGKEWLEKNRAYIGQMSSYRFYEPALEKFSEAAYA